MTWSYASTGPTSDKDFIRLTLGLTDTTDQLMTDEEITQTLTNYGNKWKAAAAVAEAVAGKFARRVDSTMGKLKFAYSQRVKAYLDLAKVLRRQAVLSGGGTLWSGAIGIDSKQTEVDDSDRVVPAFSIDMHDFPDTELSGNQIST